MNWQGVNDRRKTPPLIDLGLRGASCAAMAAHGAHRATPRDKERGSAASAALLCPTRAARARVEWEPPGRDNMGFPWSGGDPAPQL